MTCNLCGGNRHQGMPFHYMWRGDRFNGLRCRSCGLICLDHMPTDTQLQDLYSEDYFDSGLHGLDAAGTDYETMSDGSREAARAFIDEIIRTRHPEASSLFEIGAAMGHFLQAAVESGLRCSGVEFSHAAVDRARVKFGLDLHCGDVEHMDLREQAGRWDVVYAGDLLEHLRNPSAVLQQAHDLLAPGGLCVMRLPGTYNLLSTKLGSALLRLTRSSKRLPDKPYHLYEYTDRTARRMFECVFTDVEVLCTATPPSAMNLKTRSPDYLLKYLLQFLNAPLTRMTGRFGDRMTVIARKTAD